MADGSSVPKRTGATLNRGGSKQTHQTPRDFLDALEFRFGRIDWDLAADAESCVVLDEQGQPSGQFFSEEQDSLAQDWGSIEGLLFLNPPFARLDRWAKKCAEEATPRTRIILLTQASVGTNWYWQWIRPFAVTYALRPRLTFRGEKDQFPKDLMISYFGLNVTAFGRWNWKETLEKAPAEQAIRPPADGFLHASGTDEDVARAVEAAGLTRKGRKK